jgi:hypothetical protein
LALADVWRAAGFKVVLASPAAGKEDGDFYTGYYFWPRVGFKGETGDGRRIEDVMATEEGRRWWRKNGTTLWGLTYAL